MSELKDIAKKVKLPSWATHVAVSTVRKTGEPCAWHEPANDYVDEDPATFIDGHWTGGYKKIYWEFFSKEELNET